MNARDSEPGDEAPDATPVGGEATAVLPETAAELVDLERLKRALAESEERARNHWDQYLRAVADVENVRKRAQRDIEAAQRSGVEKLAAELLPVRDSLQLAVDNVDRADSQSLASGQAAVLQLLAKAFDKLGIAEINPLGQPFDPRLHEAVLVQPSDTAEPNSVIQVVQRGYQLEGKLLRPARVIVSRAPG